jgi:hypothetical protein
MQSSVDAATMAKTVTRITLSAYPKNGARDVNHWVAFLETGAEESVKVDMTPGADGSTGVILFAPKPYLQTDKAVFDIKFPTLNNPTVQQIYDLITTPDPYNNNQTLERYRFTADGDGCRYWIYRFILRVEQAGYLAQGTAGQVYQYVCNFWTSPTQYTPLAIAIGTFY